MNTKKDYIRAAELLARKKRSQWKCHLSLVETFVEFFQDDNPRFDADRFRAACGVDGYPDEATRFANAVSGKNDPKAAR